MVEMVAERAHSLAPAAAVKCGTENEKPIMTEIIAKPLNLGLPQRRNKRTVPVVQTRKNPGRQLPAVSVHVPVTPENRSRLRALRRAEMEAWNATADTGFDTGNNERRQAGEKERRELRTFGLIALMAMTTVTISLLKTASITEEWAGFVRFVHQLLN